MGLAYSNPYLASDEERLYDDLHGGRLAEGVVIAERGEAAEAHELVEEVGGEEHEAREKVDGCEGRRAAISRRVVPLRDEAQRRESAQDDALRVGGLLPPQQRFAREVRPRLLRQGRAHEGGHGGEHLHDAAHAAAALEGPPLQRAHVRRLEQRAEQAQGALVEELVAQHRQRLIVDDGCTGVGLGVGVRSGGGGGGVRGALDEGAEELHGRRGARGGQLSVAAVAQLAADGGPEALRYDLVHSIAARNG
jgi:hypothetical protein